MRRAFSLPELVLVLAFSGILLVSSIPLLWRVWDRLQVEAAASQLVSAHQRARMMAVLHGRVVILSMASDSLSIRAASETAPLWLEPGPESKGVALQGPRRSFTFSPVGLTLGLSNATLLLSRGAASRTLAVSRLGRIRIVR
jgi:Tfp pilus assembly protein FimT